MPTTATFSIKTTHPKPVRAWAPKVKSGCLTCKSRRIKCTEEKPVCSKCVASGRSCKYTPPPKAWIFEPTSTPCKGASPSFPYDGLTPTLITSPPSSSIPRADTTLTVYKTPSEQRALLFFMEKTVPVATSYGTETNEFWRRFIPQFAATHEPLRHMIIAIAARHEQVERVGTAPELAHLQPKHYAASLRALNAQCTKPAEEVLLGTAALYILYGNMDEPEHQKADALFHMVAGINILTERVSRPLQPPSEIIDTFIMPMLPRLELILSTHMIPTGGIDAIKCTVEPPKPNLSIPFKDFAEARLKFVQLCCWRWRLTARLQPWTSDSPEFKATRKQFLKWYNLMLLHTAEAAKQSSMNQIRCTALLAQFRLLFVAVIYSGRVDLHGSNHIRPTFVDLLQADMVSLTYHLPKRWLRQVKTLDWEQRPYEDPLGVRLFPPTEVVTQTGDSGLIRLTYRL